MTVDGKTVLIALRPYLLEDLSYRHVSDQLVRKGFLTKEEDKDISHLLGKARTQHFLNLIIERDNALEELIDALRHHSIYHIYKNLVQKLETTAKRLSINLNMNDSGNGSLNGSMTSNKTVEKRHFNDIVKILKRDSSKWQQLYEALAIEYCEMFSTASKLEKGQMDLAEAYRDVLDTWRENTGKHATFATLEDALRQKLKWDSAADEITSRYWD